MHHLVRFIGILLLLGWGTASAQSSLPACPASRYFHNCFGTFTWASGNKYVGEWKDNKHNGQGTFTFANGDNYVGEYKDGKYNGQGAYTWPDGEKYVGEYKNDKRNGQGIFTFADGNKYVGEFNDDMRNGQGTLFRADGSVINAGIWAEGQFVRSAPVQQQTSNTLSTERARPRAEAEEAKRRQAQAEEQLRLARQAAVPPAPQAAQSRAAGSSSLAMPTNSKGLLALEDPRRECEGKLEKDVRLSSIASKMSLSGPSDIGFTMLAELSTPDAVEQKAIALFADNIRKCIKEAESFRQQKYSKEMNAVLSQFDSDFTDMTIELYNKKITYGKFNAKLQQSDKELNDRLGIIANQIVQKNEQDEANKARAEVMRDAQRRQDQARAAEEQRLQQQRQAEQDRIVASRNRWAARCNLDKANALAQSKVRNSQECDRIYANASATTINMIGAAACAWSINDNAEKFATITFDACMSGAP